MKTGKKIFCRMNHKFINSLMPILPCRQLEILENMLDVIHVLKKEKIQSVLLVTDKGIRGLGLTQPLEQLLAEHEIACAVYDDTQANPTTANVDEAKVLYLKNDCQALISFGGGSSMDCAKGVGVRWRCISSQKIKRQQTVCLQSAGLVADASTIVSFT